MDLKKKKNKKSNDIGQVLCYANNLMVLPEF